MAFTNKINFIEAKLSLDDQPKLIAFAKKFKGGCAEAMAELLNQGYTVKVGWYPDKTSFGAFVAPTKDNKDNRGCMLSSWSDDLEEVLFMSAYKHMVVFGGGDWNSDDNQSNWG